MQDIFYPSADGKTTIHACVWQPEGEIRGILQIVHGMAEYAARYSPLAEFLNSNGYLVCAEDHLGHGKSVADETLLGYFTKGNGAHVVLQDIRRLTEIIADKHPGVPYFIMGHSMGSFFTRKYITLYGKELKGALVFGTGFQSAFTTGTAKFVTRLSALFGGWKKRSRFIDNASFSSYNKRFENRTEMDWLSSDAEAVDKYLSDAYCGFKFTCSGFLGLFSIVADACRGRTVKATPKDLPIYILSGKDDPVGDYSKGVIKLYGKLEKAGVSDLQMTLYEGARHEILNDKCAPQVMEDVLGFLEEKRG